MLNREARVVADSYCAESGTPILDLYALLAEGDRGAAAALVLRRSAVTLSAGTNVHEDERAGRLTHVRTVADTSKIKTCWLPSTMLGGPIERRTAQAKSPASR